jgi:hypothetical protein
MAAKDFSIGFIPRPGVSLSTRDWVEASVRYAASELTAGRFASSSLMSRLSEPLFVEAMRQYSVTFTDQDAGWLKGVADPQIGRHSSQDQFTLVG